MYETTWRKKIKFVSNLPNFNCVIKFDLSFFYSLLSSHLEQIAVMCPNLQRLSLQGNIKFLTSLQGLRSIASNYNNLQGLNLIGVRCKDVVQFWEVLSCMKLTHLVLDLCVTEPTDEDDRIKLIELYQKFVTLIAIESASSWDCCTCDNLKLKTEVSTLFAHFPSLLNTTPYLIFTLKVTCKSLLTAARNWSILIVSLMGMNCIFQ